MRNHTKIEEKCEWQNVKQTDLLISSPVKKSNTWTHISSPPAMNLLPDFGSSEADSTVNDMS